MTTQVQELLHSFDLLPDSDKRELATEILRRSATLDSAPLSDEELIGAADDLFSRLDRQEAENG
jgi:predicted HAD superfamily phosphohydrolase